MQFGAGDHSCSCCLQVLHQLLGMSSRSEVLGLMAMFRSLSGGRCKAQGSLVCY